MNPSSNTGSPAHRGSIGRNAWVPLAMAWLCVILFSFLAVASAEKGVPSAQTLRARVEALCAAKDGTQLKRHGVIDSLNYNLDVSERIERGFARQAQAIRLKVAGWLDSIEQGSNPLVAGGGEIFMRGYRSAASVNLQGYAVYLPPNYDPNRRYPLMLMLHGGSANGNLFLGVVLGNNMNWKEYHKHLWDAYTPRWKPDWIVVAPDGYGQVMWRYMGEQDVLDVLDNVEAHYNIDPDRIVLGGLSNGGVGAYNLGMRHAYRFAAVIPIAGAPSWLQYAHAQGTPLEHRLLDPISGMQLLDNAFNTRLQYHHGRADGGPMKPAFVDAFDKEVAALGVPAKGTWYDAGHDLLYLVHRHGRIYEQLKDLRRDPRPRQVRLVTGDYRAARQHWLEVTRIENYPRLAKLKASCEGQLLDIAASGVVSFRIHIAGLPPTSDPLRIQVNKQEVYRGPRAALGDYFHLTGREWGFAPGFPTDAPLQKRPHLSGPISDAYFDSMIHVYGTANPERSEALKQTAARGAKGWPLWLWHVEQRVVADSEVTDEMMAHHHLVLYGSPGDNQLLDRIAERLPIRVVDDKIRVGSHEFQGNGLGVKFIYPNPLAPQHYVLVHTGPTLAGVTGGHLLPDFLPDYVVFDQATTRRRPRLLYSNRGPKPLAQGFFDDHWQLSEPVQTTDPPQQKPGHDQEEAPQDPASSAPQPADKASDKGPTDTTLGALLPAVQTMSRGRAGTPRLSQAAQAATTIALRARSFPNSRARVRHGTWVNDPNAVWHIRDNDACLKQLQDERIAAEVYHGELRTPVPTPIELIGPVADIWFRSAHPDRAVLMSCELAARLPQLVAVLKRHGIRGVDVMSSYREKPLQSFHTLGLGLDLMRFWTANGSLTVLDDFELTPHHATCAAPQARTEAGRTLRAIACELAESHAFSSVLTPNYNAGHRDHFHLDARPEDPRLFTR